eukprot:6353214-Prymnesium_polylepis.1
MGCAHSRAEEPPPTRKFDEVILTKNACAKQETSVLLITNNVSGVFDDILKRLPLWVAQIDAAIDAHQADFVALHLQEVGGTNWRRTGLEHMKPFANGVIEAFPQFWCSGFLCDTNVTDTFTALGSIYLVRKTVARRVGVWEFGESEGGAGEFHTVEELPSPLVPEPNADARFCRFAQFPTQFFPEGKLSRKGYLLSRWRLDGAPLDL